MHARGSSRAMARKPIMALLLSALALLLGASSSSSSPASGSGVQGMIQDGTCAASCIPHCQPPPCVPKPGYACPQSAAVAVIICPQALPELPLYSGQAKVLVRRRGSPRVIAHQTAREGSFSIGLDAGRYLVSVAIAGRCWQGQTKRLRVEADLFSALDFIVRNGCAPHPEG